MTQRKKEVENLEHIRDEAQDILVQEKAIFPYSMFPDIITVDRVKITIYKQIFFKVGEVHSVGIEEILNVEADIGPIYGSVKIWIRSYNEQAFRIEHLSRQGALRVKEVVQGYVIARRKNIECDNVSTRKLVHLLLQLGKEQSI